MKYIEEVQKGMDFLAENPRTIFMGQAVECKGTALTHQVKNYPSNQLLELPVSEEMQAGIALGMALEGYLPVSLYPRMDFVILALNNTFASIISLALRIDSLPNLPRPSI